MKIATEARHEVYWPLPPLIRRANTLFVERASEARSSTATAAPRQQMGPSTRVRARPERKVVDSHSLHTLEANRSQLRVGRGRLSLGAPAGLLPVYTSAAAGAAADAPAAGAQAITEAEIVELLSAVQDCGHGLSKQAAVLRAVNDKLAPAAHFDKKEARALYMRARVVARKKSAAGGLFVLRPLLKQRLRTKVSFVSKKRVLKTLFI